MRGHLTRLAGLLALSSALCLGCGEVLLPDAGADAGPDADARVDTGTPDSGTPDSGAVSEDAGPDVDGGAPDAGVTARLTLRLEGPGALAIEALALECPTRCEVDVLVGTTVQIRATAATHWRLAGWSESSCSDVTCTVAVDEDLTLTATFERRDYDFSVRVVGDGAGTVTSTIGNLDCAPGPACVGTVPSESQVTLTAVPDGASTFAGWTGDCTPSGATCVMSVDRAGLEVSATFDQRVAPVTVRREGEAAADGAIAGAAGAIACPGQCTANLPVGRAITLDATTTIDTAVFTGWPSGPCAGQGARCTFAIAEGLDPVAAEFERNRLTVSTSGEPGRVTSDVGGIDCGGTCEAVLSAGTAITLTAIPATADQRFGGWTGPCAGQGATCTLTLDGPAAVDASFIVRPPPVSNHQAADLVLGQPDFTSNIANNGGESIATLNRPRYCHTDGTRLWISDGDNARVLQWNTLPVQPFMQPASVVIGQASPTAHTPDVSQTAFDLGVGKVVTTASGGVYIADLLSSRVMHWTSPPSAHGAPATAVIGQSTFAGAQRSVSQSTLDQPYSLEVVSQGLLIADSFNNRVLWHASAPTTTGLYPADSVFGQFDATGAPTFTQSSAANPPTGSTMNRPFDVHHDPVTGRLFVVDTNNHRVLGWNNFPVTPRPADFVLGQPDSNSNQPNAGQAGPNAVGMNGPRVAFVHAGSLFVSDGSNSRVMVWTPVPSASGTPARAVLGQPDLVTRGANTSNRGLTGPWGICGAGTSLYVVDISDSRALRFSLSP